MPPNLTPLSMLGAYRLTERIGKGGFSEVWSAWDTHLNRIVAVKIIPLMASDAHSKIQFGREAALITRLEHPHVLPLYDFAETPDLRYLVMRYVTGGSLAQRIERQRLPIRKILQFMMPIAATLDYIHEQRVVHRDLKPGNILLDAQESPYLADFGLAKELTDQTRPVHSASGTLTYMPPEQFSGGFLAPSSDLYSFGVLLFQLFSGQLPFEGQYALGMRQLAQAEPLPDITAIDPALPAALNDVLRQLTDPDPTRRPLSAAVPMQQIVELFHDVSGIDTGTSSFPSTQGITLALESGAYRQREAESLLQQNLAPWQKGEFTMSATHFVLLDILLRELQLLLTPDVRSLMLRGALEHNQHIDYWWGRCSAAEQQRACWHSILHGDDAVCLRAIHEAVGAPWVQNVDAAIVNVVAGHLTAPVELAQEVLQFLERALPGRDQWLSDDLFITADNHLCDLAHSRSPLAGRAAALIGSAHRTRALTCLIATGSHYPSLTVYETARSLPDSLPTIERLRLTLLLALDQLTRQPLAAFRQYLWAALGSAVGLGLMIYVEFRAADPLDVLYFTRVLNVVGVGLVFGLIYGLGIWAARHIAQRLRVLKPTLRVLFGAVVGGFIVGVGFILFQQLDLQDVIEPYIALGSGFLYVLGFALSIKLPVYLQIVCGAAGAAAAFLFSWWSYLVNSELRPPFFFDEDVPENALPLVLIASFVLACVVLGSVWWKPLRERASRKSGLAPGTQVPGSGNKVH